VSDKLLPVVRGLVQQKQQGNIILRSWKEPEGCYT